MLTLQYLYAIGSKIKMLGVTWTISAVTFNKYNEIWYDLELPGSPFSKFKVTEAMVKAANG